MLVSLLLLSAARLPGQDTYIVQLTDKDNNSYSVNKPAAFLSSRAIERRKRQHIAVRADDLPLTDRYVSIVAALAGQVVYTLKWSNSMIVKSADTALSVKLLQLPFVKSVNKISGAGPSVVQKKLDSGREKSLPASALDTGFYGAAANQNVMINVNALHQMGYWGDSVLIAVMDAGFDGAPTNPFLAKVYDEGRVIYTHDYVYYGDSLYLTDLHGAETFSCIAANIPYQMVGTAPNAGFLLFVTEDTRSEKIIEEYNWANAAETADSIGADVFSTSLGYNTFDPEDSMYNTTYATLNGHTTPIAIAANAAANKGVLVVVSAGNDGDDAWHYIATPADADSCVAVGAVDQTGTIAYFSSFGPSSSGMIKPAVCAQGYPAAVVSPAGVVTGNSGTSFSCPIIAGAFACLRQAFPDVPDMAMIAAVERTGNLYGSPDDQYGYGIPDFGLAYQYLKAEYPNDTVAAAHALVFPNPFSTSLRVSISGLLNGPVTASLYDLLGQQVWTGSFPVAEYGSNVVDITPPAFLAPGSYVMHINSTYTVRLVKEE